jgi:hypothetical protein
MRVATLGWIVLFAIVGPAAPATCDTGTDDAMQQGLSHRERGNLRAAARAYRSANRMDGHLRALECQIRSADFAAAVDTLEDLQTRGWRTTAATQWLELLQGFPRPFTPPERSCNASEALVAALLARLTGSPQDEEAWLSHAVALDPSDSLSRAYYLRAVGRAPTSKGSHEERVLAAELAIRRRDLPSARHSLAGVSASDDSHVACLIALANDQDPGGGNPELRAALLSSFQSASFSVHEEAATLDPEAAKVVDKRVIDAWFDESRRLVANRLTTEVAPLSRCQVLIAEAQAFLLASNCGRVGTRRPMADRALARCFQVLACEPSLSLEALLPGLEYAMNYARVPLAFDALAQNVARISVNEGTRVAYHIQLARHLGNHGNPRGALSILDALPQKTPPRIEWMTRRLERDRLWARVQSGTVPLDLLAEALASIRPPRTVRPMKGRFHLILFTDPACCACKVFAEELRTWLSDHPGNSVDVSVLGDVPPDTQLREQWVTLKEPAILGRLHKSLLIDALPVCMVVDDGGVIRVLVSGAAYGTDLVVSAIEVQPVQTRR